MSKTGATSATTPGAIERQADKDYQRQLELMRIQQKMHAQQQEVMTRSAIDKSKDDAMKAIIQNMK